jgi:hypothetical protein
VGRRRRRVQRTGSAARIPKQYLEADKQASNSRCGRGFQSTHGRVGLRQLSEHVQRQPGRLEHTWGNKCGVAAMGGDCESRGSIQLIEFGGTLQDLLRSWERDHLCCRLSRHNLRHVRILRWLVRSKGMGPLHRLWLSDGLGRQVIYLSLLHRIRKGSSHFCKKSGEPFARAQGMHTGKELAASSIVLIR